MKIFVFACITAVSVAGAAFFPAHDLFQVIVSQIVFFVLFPFLAIRFSLHEKASRYGMLFFSHLRARDAVRLALVFLCALGVFLAIFAWTPLHRYYFPPSALTEGFVYFLMYSVLVDGIFSLIFTFFFQGFVLFFLERFFRGWAIGLQWLFFLFALAVSGKLEWSMTAQVYAAFFAGFVAFSTRSVPTAFLFTWFFMIIVEMIVLRFF